MIFLAALAQFIERQAIRFGIKGHLRKLLIAYLLVKVVTWPVIAWATVTRCIPK
jgi:hypothetical protein